MQYNIFWFRRDLNINDNNGLYQALKTGLKIIPIFIFDDEILEELPVDDARVSFIYDKLLEIQNKFSELNSSIIVKKGKVKDCFEEILKNYDINSVYCNEDYEPYALKRDKEISNYLNSIGVNFYSFKNQVIFAKDEILKSDGKPYTVFTPYKNAWLKKFNSTKITIYKSEEYLHKFAKISVKFPTLEEIGFKKSLQKVKNYNLQNIEKYHLYRDYPAMNYGTYLGPHLRFGTIGIRELILNYAIRNEVFLSELIWREFFMQILYHFPHSATKNFNSKYDNIKWINNENDFEKWCNGETGYPIVDAGMRELNSTGYMHNRVRMIVASFLVKHLLVEWQWGEAYFASKLLDYEQSSNVGNWQWAAGTGCDAAPYFRIFNPISQQIKFDKDFNYCKKHINNFNPDNYLNQIIDHNFARLRALEAYKKGIF